VEVVAETNAVAEKEAVTAMGVWRRRSRGGSSGDPVWQHRRRKQRRLGEEDE
jgi:hypothetical protein